MSWLDDVVSIGRSVVGYVTGNSAGSALARTALLGLAVNQISRSVNRGNNTGSKSAAAATTAPDLGTRLQVNPSTEHKIPVIYGSAYLSGIVTDAVLTNNNQTMWYCITIAERPGIKLSDSEQTQIVFQDIYWNDQRIVFQPDGSTADYTLDRDSNLDRSVHDLVRIYCYAGSSTDPQVPDNYTNSGLQSAISIMPNWTSGQNMTDLIFVLVRLDYSKEKNITQLADLKFHIQADMTLPGDCLYDYMTNSRYGAGIDPQEIYSS